MKTLSLEEARPLSESLIGQTYTEALREDLAKRTGWVVRAKLEGTATTMEYEAQRLNLHLDDRSIINSVTIG